MMGEALNLFYCYEGTNITGKRVVNLHRTQLNDALIESSARLAWKPSPVPHGDSKYPHAVESFLDLDLSNEAKRKILWDNCARFYEVTDARSDSTTSDPAKQQAGLPH